MDAAARMTREQIRAEMLAIRDRLAILLADTAGSGARLERKCISGCAQSLTATLRNLEMKEKSN